MPSKLVEPQLGAASFSCPHCGAYAQQHFFRVFAKSYDKGKGPAVFRYERSIHDAIKKSNPPDDEAQRMTRLQLEFLERLKKHAITYDIVPYGETCHWEMTNLVFSRCYSCDGFAIWVEDKLIHPVRNTTVTAHEDMPSEVRSDFDEAASIVDKSPRGAAALLRLCIEKLMAALGEKGKDLNDDIASLVAQGLPVQVQQALDIVRVTGNNAVHPGRIDLKDDKATATTLFNLVNLIVENRIAQPSHIRAMFNSLPPGALEQIKRRDAPPPTDAEEEGPD
jgi:Domain of unknown function (DUF4145)